MGTGTGALPCSWPSMRKRPSTRCLAPVFRWRSCAASFALGVRERLSSAGRLGSASGRCGPPAARSARGPWCRRTSREIVTPDIERAGRAAGRAVAGDRQRDHQRRAEPARGAQRAHHRPVPRTPGARVAGPALTLQCLPKREDLYQVDEYADPERATAPSRAVPRAARRRGGRRRARRPESGIFGEMMLTYLRGRGGVGVVVDGCIRDFGSASRLGSGLWLRGTTPNFHSQTDICPVRRQRADRVRRHDRGPGRHRRRRRRRRGRRADRARPRRSSRPQRARGVGGVLPPAARARAATCAATTRSRPRPRPEYEAWRRGPPRVAADEDR